MNSNKVLLAMMLVLSVTVFAQSGRKQKKEDLPPVQGRGSMAGRPGADEQRCSNDGAESQGGQPEPEAGVEVMGDVGDVPNGVTPEDRPAAGKSGQVLKREGKLRG